MLDILAVVVWLLVSGAVVASSCSGGAFPDIFGLSAFGMLPVWAASLLFVICLLLLCKAYGERHRPS